MLVHEFQFYFNFFIFYKFLNFLSRKKIEQNLDQKRKLEPVQ